MEFLQAKLTLHGDFQRVCVYMQVSAWTGVIKRNIKMYKDSQTAENMAAASDSPPHPELSPNPAVCQNSCQEPNTQLFHLQS